MNNKLKMDKNWNTQHVDLENLLAISRGSSERMLKYLLQFKELIPLRIQSLKNSVEADERKMIRQILHQMFPQLQFFGISGILNPIRRLEHEYESMPKKELEELVLVILTKLEHANNEVNRIIETKF